MFIGRRKAVPVLMRWYCLGPCLAREPGVLPCFRETGGEERRHAATNLERALLRTNRSPAVTISDPDHLRT